MNTNDYCFLFGMQRVHPGLMSQFERHKTAVGVKRQSSSICDDDNSSGPTSKKQKNLHESFSVSQAIRESKDGSDSDDNFYKFESHSTTAVDHATLMQPAQYLEDNSRSLDLLKSFPIVQDMFKKYNTVIPSSAPVECLFSSGGQIMTPRRNGLSDETFEKLLLLKQNANCKQ